MTTFPTDEELREGLHHESTLALHEWRIFAARWRDRFVHLPGPTARAWEDYCVRLLDIATIIFEARQEADRMLNDVVPPRRD